jgi:hypothetical protein
MTVHRPHPPARAMRENPDIDQLRRQARELLEAYRAQSPDAIIEVAAHHRTATPETFALHDAQFVLARSYGFESWPKLKAAVEGVTAKQLHEAVQKGDLGAVRALLARRPEIVDLLREGPSGFEIRAIHIAVMARDVEMTRLLLRSGSGHARRHLDEFLKSTPLGWACRWGRVELAKLLLAGGPIRSSVRPSRGPHRSRGPNGVNMRGLHRSSGNTELTGSCSRGLMTRSPQHARHGRT